MLGRSGRWLSEIVEASIHSFSRWILGCFLKPDELYNLCRVFWVWHWFSYQLGTNGFLSMPRSSRSLQMSGILTNSHTGILVAYVCNLIVLNPNHITRGDRWNLDWVEHRKLFLLAQLLHYNNLVQHQNTKVIPGHLTRHSAVTSTKVTNRISN